jgi:hypothetical protein
VLNRSSKLNPRHDTGFGGHFPPSWLGQGEAPSAPLVEGFAADRRAAFVHFFIILP